MEKVILEFKLNGKLTRYEGDSKRTLLDVLRDDYGIFSVKDGCSGQAFCGACMVEMDGKPTLSCVTKMAKVANKRVTTIEAFPERLKDQLAKAFVKKGAVQCGFCSPGFLTRTKILLENNPKPTRDEIIQALKFNFCRCTGYHHIIEAVQYAAEELRQNREIELLPQAKSGSSHPKLDAYRKALGESPFTADLRFNGQLFGALKFSDHPRAIIKRIDTSSAEELAGVRRVFTWRDIPGKRYNGLIVSDWPMMIAEGESTRYIGDVLAGVVAETEALARQAVQAIKVEYEVLEPLTELTEAEDSPITVHPDGPLKGQPNLLDTCVVQRGDKCEDVFSTSEYVVEGHFSTQRIEHAFLETECAVALPEEDGLRLYSQGQGVYVDRKQVAEVLDIPLEKLRVTLVPNGGGFGGKEDLSVQHHSALYAYLLQAPVSVRLSREESIRFHPKRHPMEMDFKLACDADGKLTGIRARILGDTGAYASVGAKVLERAAGHATGGYHFPSVDLIGKTLYTNNIPCGAMRGFGANQATFALESLMDELCEKGGFDRWQFRYDNALVNGSMTSTGQVLESGVGIRETLLAVKDQFYAAKYAGLACGIKNCGVGNGMVDESRVKIEIRAENRILIHHGWTEMGQGANTIAVQVVAGETNLDPDSMEVLVSTEFEAEAGMTTSSRGTSLLGNSLLNACEKLNKDLKLKELSDLRGQVYEGYWGVDFTTKPGAPGKVITHYSYSYATQLAIVDDDGRVSKVVAAHDAGKIMNPVLFEGQIQGSVHMGVGYALSEDLPMKDGQLISDRMRKLGILSMRDTPEIEVIGVEVPDPLGPYGAKGVGEVGLVPTAGAVANALKQYDGKRRYRLPLQRDE